MDENRISYKAFQKLKNIYDNPGNKFISTIHIKQKCKPETTSTKNAFIPFIKERGSMNNIIGKCKEVPKQSNIYSYIDVTKILRKIHTKKSKANIDINDQIFPSLTKQSSLGGTSDDASHETSKQINAKFITSKKQLLLPKKKKRFSKISLFQSNSPQLLPIKLSEHPDVGHYNVYDMPSTVKAFKFSTLERGLNKLAKTSMNSLDDIPQKEERCKGFVQVFSKQLPRYKHKEKMPQCEALIGDQNTFYNPLPFYAIDDLMTERMRKKDAKVFAILGKIKSLMIKQNLM